MAAREEALHLPPQIRQRRIEGSFPWIDHDGPLGVQPIELAADGLADAPLDAVANHRTAQGARHGKADARAIRQSAADTEGREQRAGVAGSLVIDSAEIDRSQQADTFRKTSDGVLPLGTDGQLLSPSRPPPGKHGPAVLGFHAAAKAMRLRPMAVVRLKGTFRHCRSSI